MKSTFQKLGIHEIVRRDCNRRRQSSQPKRVTQHSVNCYEQIPFDTIIILYLRMFQRKVRSRLMIRWTVMGRVCYTGGGIEAGCCDAGDSVRQRLQRTPHFLRRALDILVVCSAVVNVAAVFSLLFGWIFVVLLAVEVFLHLAVRVTMQWLYVALVTLPRDVRALLRYLGLLLQTFFLQRRDSSVVDVFRERVRKHPNKPCFIFEDKAWTFIEMESYSNKVAQVFQKEGFHKGDVVALMMENRPEFVCIWLGLAKLGVIVPLINYNLRQLPLLHSLRSSGARALIFGAEVVGAVEEAAVHLQSHLQLFPWERLTCRDTCAWQSNLEAQLNAAADAAPEVVARPRYRDPLIYIFTSGTTGLPKAAVIDHSRFLFIVGAISWLAAFRERDRFYTPLPLYHTAAGIMAVGQALLYGSTVVLRRKFSASCYFSDIRHYECTVSQYIGEMCRYLLAVPPQPEDAEHKLRLIFGNGLRPQIWRQFVDRFGISQVAEFYGATEGNANIVNTDNTYGAVGFVSRILPIVYPIALLRIDEASGQPLRDERGLCMRCVPGEPGVFVGKIVPSNPARQFLGYVDKEASQKKIVYDVFHKGDSAFLSGDIMVSDKWGYLFFRDRTGDTFRWKGENVSTSEVEAVISNIFNYCDCIVYGVEVPGLEGRAGMAAIAVSEGSLDIIHLTEGMKLALPTYARPQFIRLVHRVDLTGTFKMKKKDLQEEGYDPRLITDSLLYLDSKSGRYEPLSEDAYTRIIMGSIRL